MGPLGAILGPSWAVLGRLGAILGPSWAVLGHLGAILGPLELSWGCLGPSWAVLGPSWAILISSTGGNRKNMKKKNSFGTKNELKMSPKSNQFWGRFRDPFQEHFGGVRDAFWDSILGQDGSKRGPEASRRAFWSGKKRKERIFKKCYFPMEKP